MNSPEIERFWQEYLATLPAGAPRPQSYSAWYFGDTPELADELAALALGGIKTATASLVWDYEAENEPIPKPGDLSILTDFGGRPLGIIETTRVDIAPYNEVGAEQAYLEGEGDRSLDFWREAHWRYFSRTCAAQGREPSSTMPVVCERFRLVYPAPRLD